MLPAIWFGVGNSVCGGKTAHTAASEPDRPKQIDGIAGGRSVRRSGRICVGPPDAAARTTPRREAKMLDTAVASDPRIRIWVIRQGQSSALGPRRVLHLDRIGFDPSELSPVLD